ncbi:MAG: acyl carrier protein [Kiritimatiellia bacterium]|jgi:acyl carrier protein
MTYSKDGILNEITTLMMDLFEVDAKEVTLNARLHDDLGIDSIDTIDLMLALKSHLGRKISPEEFASVRTVGDIVDTVHELMSTHEP